MDHHKTQSPDIPKWSALLVDAVNEPGLIMKAYTGFWNYSIGNQLLALVQCHLRSLEPGPINTIPGWQALGRHVKHGERALMLCMPVTRKRRNETAIDDDANEAKTLSPLLCTARIGFVLSQTEGQKFEPAPIPQWDAERALAVLNIERISFEEPNGNCQSYAKARRWRFWSLTIRSKVCLSASKEALWIGIHHCSLK